MQSSRTTLKVSVLFELADLDIADLEYFYCRLLPFHEVLFAYESFLVMRHVLVRRPEIASFKTSVIQIQAIIGFHILFRFLSFPFKTDSFISGFFRFYVFK